MALTTPTNDLTGNTIASTYDQLLILDNADGIVENTLKVVSTQLGKSALQIDDEKVLIKGVDTSNAIAFEVQEGADATSYISIGTGATTKGVTINESGQADIDFRVEGSGAANALFVDGTNGNVGIGIATPAVLLHIQTAAEISASIDAVANELVLENADHCGMTIISDNASGKTGNVLFGDSASSTVGGLQYQHNPSSGTERMDLRAGDSAKMVITSAGNVGIGTASPDNMLHMEGSAPELVIKRNANNDGAPKLTLIKARGTSVGDYTIVQDDDDLGYINFLAADGGDYATVGATIYAKINGTPGANDMPTELRFGTTADGANSPTDRMFILANGNVGIGTAAPEAKLHVLGTIAGDESATSLAETASRACVRIQPRTDGSDQSLWFHSLASYHLGIQGATEDGAAATSICLQSFGGNVGIGTAAPGEKLQVGLNTSGENVYIEASTHTDAKAGFVMAVNGAAKWSIANSAADQIQIYDFGDSSVAMHCDTTEEAWGTGSDSRIKENVIDIDSILTKLNNLRPITYQRKYSKSDKTYAGLVAQEVLPYFPLMVSGTEDSFKEVPETEEMSASYEGGLSLKYASFVPYLIKAIQELSAKVTALENA